MNEEIEENVALLRGPLDGYIPDDIRKLFSHDNSDMNLAQLIAKVSNQVGWVSHDIDLPENDYETNERIIKEFDSWEELYEELLREVIKRLEKENKTKGTNHVLSGIGYHYIIKPFMEKNGYGDYGGWWMKDDDDVVGKA